MLFFLVAAAASLFAVTRFADSTSSLNLLVEQSIPVVEDARQLDDAVQQFAKLVVEGSNAATIPEYDLAYEKSCRCLGRCTGECEAGFRQPEGRKNLPNLLRVRLWFSLDQMVKELDDRFLKLDATLLNLLELKLAEQRIFTELRAELVAMRERNLDHQGYGRF